MAAFISSSGRRGRGSEFSALSRLLWLGQQWFSLWAGGGQCLHPRTPGQRPFGRCQSLLRFLKVRELAASVLSESPSLLPQKHAPYCPPLEPLSAFRAWNLTLLRVLQGCGSLVDILPQRALKRYQGRSPRVQQAWRDTGGFWCRAG